MLSTIICKCVSPKNHIFLSTELQWTLIRSLLLLSRFSCVQLRDPMDCSLPGSSTHGIFQARVLEWVAVAFSDKIFSYSHLKVFFVIYSHCFTLMICKTVPAEVFHLGLPRWSNGEEAACQCRAHRFDPWSGFHMPQATEPAHHNYWSHESQVLSPGTATTEPAYPRAYAPKRGHCHAKLKHHN